MNKFFKRFGFAFEGVFYLIRNDRNVQIHLVFLALVCAFGMFFKISGTEWTTVLLCSGLVISLEAMNTALEKLADHVEGEIHPNIKIVKDVSAGAVLIAAIFSFVIALIIFIPKVLVYLKCE